MATSSNQSEYVRTTRDVSSMGYGAAGTYFCSIHTPLDRLALAPYGLHEKRKAYPIGLSIPLLLFVLADLLLSLQFLIPSHFQWVVTILKVLIVSCIFLWWRAPCELVFQVASCS